MGTAEGCLPVQKTKFCAVFWSGCLHSKHGLLKGDFCPFPVPLVKQQVLAEHFVLQSHEAFSPFSWAVAAVR